MAIFGHAAVGIALGRAYQGRADVPLLPACAAGIALAALPDLDFFGAWFGAEYGTDWGHRGFTHSFLFAAVVALLIGWIAGRCGLPRAWTALIAGLALASHGLLDTLTNGTNGPALLWPFSSARFQAPIRPVLVAPLGWAYFGSAGMRSLVRELLLFWPFLLYAVYPRGSQVGGVASTDCN
ncbi:MAG TPA: metal-dependent hydrolase [Polyangiales bacterium]|nr:metal-dependent hydrolase [Polyangiales bacterium]